MAGKSASSAWAGVRTSRATSARSGISAAVGGSVRATSYSGIARVSNRTARVGSPARGALPDPFRLTRLTLHRHADVMAPSGLHCEHRRLGRNRERESERRRHELRRRRDVIFARPAAWLGGGRRIEARGRDVRRFRCQKTDEIAVPWNGLRRQGLLGAARVLSSVASSAMGDGYERTQFPGCHRFPDDFRLDVLVFVPKKIADVPDVAP